ncbi:MAG: hypothetical protein ACE5HS_03635 [bacterium]
MVNIPKRINEIKTPFFPWLFCTNIKLKIKVKKANSKFCMILINKLEWLIKPQPLADVELTDFNTSDSIKKQKKNKIISNSLGGASGRSFSEINLIQKKIKTPRKIKLKLDDRRSKEKTTANKKKQPIK